MRESTTAEPVNLHRIEEEFFRQHIRRRVLEYHAHFGPRLAAIYVFGSVHRNEAIPGVSDLDMCYVITDTFGEADEQWIWRVREEFDRECPGLHGATHPHPVEALLQGLQPGADEDAQVRTQTFGIRLRYDATLAYGRDLAKGLPLPPPDRDWARRRFWSPSELTRYAAGLTSANNTDFDLPAELPLRLRKLARLAVLTGAYLLMARGEFRSFRGLDVIPMLEQLFPEWTGFLEETRALYIQPRETTPEEVAAYLSKLVLWMAWIKPQLEPDAAG